MTFIIAFDHHGGSLEFSLSLSGDGSFSTSVHILSLEKWVTPLSSPSQLCIASSCTSGTCCFLGCCCYFHCYCYWEVGHPSQLCTFCALYNCCLFEVGLLLMLLCVVLLLLLHCYCHPWVVIVIPRLLLLSCEKMVIPLTCASLLKCSTPLMHCY